MSNWTIGKVTIIGHRGTGIVTSVKIWIGCHFKTPRKKKHNEEHSYNLNFHRNLHLYAKNIFGVSSTTMEQNYNKVKLNSLLSEFINLMEPFHSTNIVNSIAWSISRNGGPNASKLQNAILNFISKISVIPPSYKR